MIGCEFCVDLGSQICRNSGLPDAVLLALPRYRQSELFTEREKLALDYTVAVMRTPVEVTDELFARIKEHFTDKQLVEITALLTVVNVDRFQRRLRDRVGRLLRRDGVRVAGSSGQQAGGAGKDRLDARARSQPKALADPSPGRRPPPGRPHTYRGPTLTALGATVGGTPSGPSADRGTVGIVLIGLG